MDRKCRLEITKMHFYRKLPWICLGMDIAYYLGMTDIQLSLNLNLYLTLKGEKQKGDIKCFRKELRDSAKRNVILRRRSIWTAPDLLLNTTASLQWIITFEKGKSLQVLS